MKYEEKFGSESPKWTLDSMQEKLPALDLVIDLTNTNRYYDVFKMTVKHVKINTEGRKIPSLNVINK